MAAGFSMKASGLDGQIELLTDRIIITRPGGFSVFKFGLNGTRELPYTSISEVLFRDAKALSFGTIEFIRHGIHDKKHRHFYIVKFKRDKSAQFTKLKEKVYEILNYYARQK